MISIAASSATTASSACSSSVRRISIRLRSERLLQEAVDALIDNGPPRTRSRAPATARSSPFPTSCAASRAASRQNLLGKRVEANIPGQRYRRRPGSSSISAACPRAWRWS